MDLHLEPMQTMAIHTIKYKRKTATVEVIQKIDGVPEFFFNLTYPGGTYLLSRSWALENIWLSDPHLSPKAAARLATSIERQIGYQLPARANNNPFDYNGDIEVLIETFELDKVIIRRAAAPYNDDIYFQILFPGDRCFTWVKTRSDPGEDEFCYCPVDRLSMKDYNILRNLLMAFDQAYSFR